MTSRKYYDMELQKLNGALLEMGEMIRMAIGGAVAALLEHDHDRARSIIVYDEEIDKQNRQIEQQCYSLLLSQQRVAGDGQPDAGHGRQQAEVGQNDRVIIETNHK